MSTPPDAASAPRRNPWPVFLAGLTILANLIAVVILCREDTMISDGKPSIHLVREAFSGMSWINVGLAVLTIASVYFRQVPAGCGGRG